MDAEGFDAWRDAVSDPVDLTLLGVNPDGTARETVTEVGACDCSAVLPELTWSGDEVAVTVPDGPDQGFHIEEMP